MPVRLTKGSTMAKTSQRFDDKSFEVGGKIVIPDSFVSKEEGTILHVDRGSITVEWNFGQTKKIAMVSYTFLNAHYGEPDVPFDTP